MSRTKAEKKALRASRTQFVRVPLPPLPEVTPEQGTEAVKLLLALSDWGEGSCSFSMSRAWEGGTCAQETGHDYNCSMCSALDFLKRIGAIPLKPYIRKTPE